MKDAVSEQPSHQLSSKQWYVMPATVFFIGLASIALLLWADRTNSRLRADAIIVDAIMDAQIHAATGHLWLEESLGGDAGVQVEQVVAPLDKAIRLVEVILNGGKTEHDWLSEPLQEAELRARAQTLRTLLIRSKMLGLDRLRHPETSGIGSAADDHFDAAFLEIFSKARELEDIVETDRAADVEKAERLFQVILVIWTSIVFVATGTLWSRERERKRAKEELLKAHEQVLAQTEELASHREHLAELVEKRTAALKAANQRIHLEMNERLQASEALQDTQRQVTALSSRLLAAQEVERKRISMELHDELGQALNVTKLRIRMIERALREDQGPLRQECEELLDYMNCVIDDVRRLSLALSPTVLEDLGLSSALRWLAGNLAAYQKANLSCSIEDIDRLFPESHWITIYRIVQEALTNIEKHAVAQNVRVDIRCGEDGVAITIEDDGKGFDPERTAQQEPGPRGFGLITMNERVRLMGGGMELTSGAGKGTRIVFTIPIGTEGEQGAGRSLCTA